MSSSYFDAVVLGGGAAGLFCAAEAAKRGRRIAVLERSAQPGRKLLISGGGRCNFTNIHTRAENFLSANPHFAKSALARYTPADFLALVERHRIPWHEKTLGQLFCDRSAADVLNMLRTECQAGGVELLTGCTIRSLTRDTRFRAETSHGVFDAAAVVVATGGLSIPRIGATGFGYEVARQFGHRIVDLRPALVPLVFDRQDQSRWGRLAGVSTDVIAAAAGGVKFREKMLFTHRGLSGPSILQVSSYWRPHTEIEIDLCPGIDIAQELSHRRAETGGVHWKTALAARLPGRLAEAWVAGDTRPLAAFSQAEIETEARRLHGWRLRPSGTEGYEKAEVTAGGVDTGELSSKTMESRRVTGLFFIGEVVDVTGHLGGFNFQWAWSSAYACAQAL